MNEEENSELEYDYQVCLKIEDISLLYQCVQKRN